MNISRRSKVFATAIVFLLASLAGCDAPTNSTVDAPAGESTIVDDTAKTKGDAASSPDTVDTPKAVIEISEPEKFKGQTAEHFEVRTWSDSSGKFTVDATFVAYEDPSVTLKRENGAELSVAFSRLSEADKAYVRKVTKLRIPNVLYAHVTAVLAGNRISVKDRSGNIETILLDGFYKADSDARKQLVPLVFDKDVEVRWLERDQIGWIVGDVYVAGKKVAVSVTSASLDKPESLGRARTS